MVNIPGFSPGTSDRGATDLLSIPTQPEVHYLSLLKALPAYLIYFEARAA